MVTSLEYSTIIVLGLCIPPVFFLNILFRRLKLPSMVVPLVSGLLLNYLIAEHLVLASVEFNSVLQILASLGIIMVFFFIGMKVDFRYMKNVSKKSSMIALGAGIVPFIFGFAAGYSFTNDIIKAIFVGIALALTAEEVSIVILDEMNLLNKKIGQVIIEAGIIGDLFEIAAITLLGIFVKTLSIGGMRQIFWVAIELFFMLFVFLLMRYYLIEKLLVIIGRKGRRFEYFSAAIVVLMIMTLSSEILNFSYVVGALLAGLLIKDKMITDKLYYVEHNIVQAIEFFNFGLFEPIILLWIGFSVEIWSLFGNIWFGLILTILALYGKIIGCIGGNYLFGGTIKEGILFGWGFNARGGIELFAMLIASNLGLITPEIFSAVVFMAISSTLISPVIFKYLLADYAKKKN